MKAKGGKKDDNAAFYSNDSGKGKGGSNSKKNAECYNCGKKGHYKNDCWEEGGRKEGQGPKQKGKGKGKSKGKEKETEKEKEKEKESAMVAQEKKETKPKDAEEAWMVKACDDTVKFFSPEPVYDDFNVSDTDSNYEAAYSCFIEDEDRTDTSTECEFELADLIDGVDEVLDADHDDQSLGAIPEDIIRTSFDAAYLAGTNETRSVEVDLYDSGATRYMSGFLHIFSNFVEIDPIPIMAADTKVSEPSKPRVEGTCMFMFLTRKKPTLVFF